MSQRKRLLCISAGAKGLIQIERLQKIKKKTVEGNQNR